MESNRNGKKIKINGGKNKMCGIKPKIKKDDAKKELKKLKIKSGKVEDKILPKTLPKLKIKWK